MLKFIHISDSHLGFSDLDAVNDEGFNIRESDFFDAFSQSVDIIIQEKPDFVLHTGDLFHRASPSNRSLIFAAKELQRITDAGIPFYMIAGNHDYPKMTSTAPIHELLLMNDKLKIFYDEKYTVTEEPGYILHMLPHINNEEKFKEAAAQINAVRNSGKPEILAMHLSIGGFHMEELGERVFPVERNSVLRDFNYVAMGHWHRFKKMERYGNVWYAGSTERTSASQTGYAMGVVRVTIDGDTTTAELLPVKLREWHVFTINNCSAGGTEGVINEITEKIKTEANGVTEGKIFHVHLHDIGSFRPVTDSDIHDLLTGAIEVQISAYRVNSSGMITADDERTDLRGSLDEMLTKEFTEESDLEKVRAIVKEMWESIDIQVANAGN